MASTQSPDATGTLASMFKAERSAAILAEELADTAEQQTVIEEPCQHAAAAVNPDFPYTPFYKYFDLVIIVYGQKG